MDASSRTLSSHTQVQHIELTKMYPVEGLRGFVLARLNAAADEIFGVFKRAIVEYEEEIIRQRKLLDIAWRPHVHLERIELRPQPAHQEEGPSVQQPCNQNLNSTVDQLDPGPPQIKEEPEEICTSKEEEPIGTVDSVSRKKYTCGACGETFTMIGSLKKHITIHTGEKRFTCKTCGKSFRLGAYLAQHERTHTDERPFVCKWCNRSFNSNSNLRSHWKTHTGDRRFPCSTCGKRFYKGSDLRRHYKVHTRGSNNNKSLTFMNDLAVHLTRVHVGQTSYF